ncbi:adenosylcobinamide-GDP ribazoletransferase [Streptosporangium sp. NPDC049046]|uniref:adenosylcobinamide-GDP ribazoletransferase n=1 Tax=Streptosporangium sp. NPDC049046 TaxID=3155031 RepID=UPI00343F1F28
MSQPSTPPENGPSGFIDGVRLAIGTLSVFPVRPGVVDRRAGGIAMAVAPLVGAVIGACGGMVLVISLWLGMTPLPASVLAVATVALLTRGLHLDGLADLADGLGSAKPAERALEIMKRSDIGPFGVVTLVLVLLIQVAALQEAIAYAGAGTGAIILVAACTAGRLALTWACREGIPPARPDGLGAMVAGTVRRSVAVVMTALMLVGTTALVYLHGALGPWPSGSLSELLGGVERSFVVYSDSVISSYLPELETGITDVVPTTALGPFLDPRGLPLAMLVGLLAAWAVRRRAVRRLGGVTGDVLGALVEIATATTLLACTILTN